MNDQRYELQEEIKKMLSIRFCFQRKEKKSFMFLSIKIWDKRKKYLKLKKGDKEIYFFRVLFF